MEVITIESKAYKELVAKINTIAKFVAEAELQDTENLEEKWVDSYDVCTFLNISSRTLQRLRSKGYINYSLIGGKSFYTIAEIKRMLEEKKIRGNQEALQNLIDNHCRHAEQRRNTKPNK